MCGAHVVRGEPRWSGLCTELASTQINYAILPVPGLDTDRSESVDQSLDIHYSLLDYRIVPDDRDWGEGKWKQ